jgi:DNA-binding SARP family transcriptional activator/DNA-binding transcriptional ArsR family regulator
MQVQVRLLGRFSVRRNGEEVPPREFGGRLVRRLIRVLLTRRGQFVSRDFLIHALWPTGSPADPAANLNVMVNRARRALDPSLLLTGPGGYSFLQDERCVVDAELFLAPVEAGRSLLASGQPAPALKSFLQALEHWGGEPLAEDAYEDWAQEYRTGLSRAYSDALEGAAEAALAVRDLKQAVALAEQAVQREPLREPAHLLLIRALAASGDAAAALARFQVLRRYLADELGLDPSPAALQLEARILRSAYSMPAIRHAPATFVTPTLERLRFVGRQSEIERVRAGFIGSALGTVLVAGSAGTGKTRLLSEAAALASLPVIGVSAFFAERDQPWALARSLLRQVLDLDPKVAPSLPNRLAESLVDIVPELEELAKISGTAMEPETRRALALEGAVRVVEPFASRGALLLVDDLQWADATSLVLLGLLRRRLSHLGMVMAYRTEEVHGRSAVNALFHEFTTLGVPLQRVSLGPLGPDAIHELVPDEAVADAIVEDGDLTPFGVAQLIGTLADQGVIEAAPEGRWKGRAEQAFEITREAARAGKRQGIRIRIERESQQRKQVLALLSLIGREAPARLIASLTGLDQPTLLDDLDALSRAGLVRLGEEGWAAAHDLIAETIAEGLDREQRGRLHALLAEALEREGADPAETARHLASAGDTHAAARAFAEAGRQRLERFANDEAEHLADIGLRLTSQPHLRSELYEIRAESRARRGDITDAQHDLRAALSDKRAGPERARILTRLAMITSGSEGYRRATEQIEMALTEAGTDKPARARALAIAAMLDMNTGRGERSRARSDEALALFEELGDAHGIADILDNRAMHTWILSGQPREAVAMLDQVARLFTDTGDLLRVVTPLAMRGLILAVIGRPEEGLLEIEKALETARITGQHDLAFLLWAKSEALSAMGRPTEAIEIAEAAHNLACKMQHREFMAGTLVGLGLARQLTGDIEGAEVSFRRAVEEALNAPIVSWFAKSRLASLLVLRGDLASAEVLAHDLLEASLPIFHYEASLALAEIALIRGDPEAESVAREAITFSEKENMSPTLERVKKLVEEASAAR